MTLKRFHSGILKSAKKIWPVSYTHLDVYKRQELRGYQFADVQGQGFIPVYTKTKLTDKLHEISGFRTDFEFLTKSKMREIQKKSKGK